MNKFENEYWWHVGRRFIIMRLIEKYVAFFKSGLSIVDVGCGTGGNYDFLEKFGKVMGVDNSVFAIEYCAKKGKEAKLFSGKKLPFSADSQDLVTILDVLEHVENDYEMLKECRRILKKGGKIILTVPAYNYLWSRHDEILGHYRRYSKKDLLDKLDGAGFRIIRENYCISFLFPFIFIYRMLVKKIAGKKKTKSAYVMLPKPVNKLFIYILDLESRFVLKMKMLFGCSIVVIAEKSGK